MKLYIGTSGYSYPAWKGTFYPGKLPAKQMLSFYATRFPTVEINNTFYRMPAESMLTGWLDEVPSHFRFVIKAPQRITHMARLKDADDTVAAFYRIIAVLGERLGPVLYQLPPFMKKDLERLKNFLKILPSGQATFEFRHESWFDEDTLAALRDHNAALCIADSDKFTVPYASTASFSYFRLRRTEYDEEALEKWALTVAGEKKAATAYVFFKHEDEGKGPAFAESFMRKAAAQGASAPQPDPA